MSKLEIQGKKNHQAAIISDDGNPAGKTFKFSNTIDGFNLLLERLSAVSTDLSQFEIDMEATGHYWLNLYTRLSDKNFKVHVRKPLQSDALRNLYIRKTKTDSADSRIIADVIRIGQYSEPRLADDKIIALHDLSRHSVFIWSTWLPTSGGSLPHSSPNSALNLPRFWESRPRSASQYSAKSAI